MKLFCFAVSLGWMMLSACQSNPTAPTATAHKPEQKTDTTRKKNATPVFWKDTLMDALVARFSHKVDIDSLLQAITHQERVKVIATLAERWNNAKGEAEYYDSSFHFSIRQVPDPEGCRETSAIFTDGKTQINFKNYHPLCLADSSYQCEDYGFNCDNGLSNPKVIEVAGKRFLYSDMNYWCNGMGCGCVLTFIYDLQTHRPVFLETFRLSMDGFLVSDFDGDGQADLLLIAQDGGHPAKGYELEEMSVKLVAYDFNSGRPKPKWNAAYNQLYSYELYTLLPSYGHMSHSGRTYSVVQDEWLGH